MGWWGWSWGIFALLVVIVVLQVVVDTDICEPTREDVTSLVGNDRVRELMAG